MHRMPRHSLTVALVLALGSSAAAAGQADAQRFEVKAGSVDRAVEKSNGPYEIRAALVPPSAPDDRYTLSKTRYMTKAAAQQCSTPLPGAIFSNGFE